MTLFARVVRGAARNIGREVPILRDGRWTTGDRAVVGEVYVATERDLAMWGSKLERVDPRELPPLPGEGAVAESEAESEEAQGRAGATATREAVDPGSVASADVVDIELYRIGDSEVFELPNGAKVVGAEAARAALGLEE